MTGPTDSSMEAADDLHDRLLRAGEMWRADQPALAATLPRRRQGLRARALVPLAAAAAVAAIAGSVALLDEPRKHKTPVPITVVVAQADDRDPDTQAAHNGPEYAPPPLGPDPHMMFNGDCHVGQVTATLTLANGAGALRVTGGAPQEQACGLPGSRPSLRIVAGDASADVPTTYPGQPDLPNPPTRPEEVLRTPEALVAALDWPSWCGPRQGRLELVGLAVDPVPVTLAGELPACRDHTSALALGRLSSGYTPTGIVPRDRAGLRVLVQYPAEVPPGFVRPYTVRLQNPTQNTISLRPCPTYLLSLENPRSGAAVGGSTSGSSGALPCQELPEQLRSGEEVTVTLEARFGAQDPKIRGVQPLTTWWGISGAAPYEQLVPMRFAEPRPPVADVPWKDTPVPPGQPQQPEVGDALPYAPLQPTIEGLPATAKPGQTVRYTVRLTNSASGGAPIKLTPCPGFVQYLQIGARDERSELTDEHYLNCEAAPATLAAGTSILLRMELPVPSDAVGEGLLTWKVGKLDNGGSPSDFAKLSVVQ